ncbi:MAG: hypothetical protein V4850_25710 [Myxococcota bacterium]
MLLLLLSACGFGTRLHKALIAPEYVTEAAPSGSIAAVTWQSGEKDIPPTEYAPEQVVMGSRTFDQAVEITSAGWIDVAPLREDVELRLWVRNPGLVRRDFTRVRSVTGALDGEVPNEVRFVPDRLEAPLHLPLKQLTNVYNDYALGDGDLLLLEARVDGEEPERFLFVTQELGPRLKFGAGVLFTVPLSFLGVNQPDSTSPVLAVTASLGWRFRTTSPVLRWFGTKSALLVSVGVGSTSITDLSKPLDEQVRGAFGSTIAGGGFEFYDFVSVQGLVNFSSLGRDLSEAPWVLAVGFDAVQFGLFTRDVGARLLRKNTLDEGPPPP